MKLIEIGYVGNWLVISYLPGIFPQHGDIVFDNNGIRLGEVRAWGQLHLDEGVHLALGMRLFGEVDA